MDERPGLTGGERAELERLRAEVAALRASAGEKVVTTRRTVRQRWRTVVATLLIVLACVLAPLSVVAVWAKNQVSDTDRYVATVAPLAEDPAIQRAMTDKITAQVFTYIDVKGLTTQAIDALASRGLPPQAADQLQGLAGPIANGVENFTRSQIARIVASQAFADAWVQANRLAHQELVKALTGEGGGAVTVENDTVSVNMAAFVQTVKQQLVASGFSLAARIPEVNASFTIFQSADVARVRSAFNLLNTLGIWLPVIVLLLIVLGVYVAKDHRRALVGAGLGVAVAMVVLALGLAVFRSVYLNGVPADVLPHDAAAVLYDTIVRFLRAGLRTILVLGLVVAAGAFLTGQSVTAVRTRQGLAHAIGWLRGGAEQAGLRTGPVGTWVHDHLRALRIGAVALAALVLVFWGRPTGKVVIGLALALLVALAVIEFLARPGQPAAEVTTTPQT
jgi:Na+-translocating ferredoxin:NAD+ oxidoreductase RnfE subunit